MELDILIITNALATSLSLLVAVVMMLNKNNIFHKIIPYVILALALYNLIDLLNLSVNHAYFYSLFNIRYSQFQNYILAFNSFAIPLALMLLLITNSKADFKYSKIFSLPFFIFFFFSFFLAFFFFEKQYKKTILFSYFCLCTIFYFYIILVNKKTYKENNIYHFIMISLWTFVLFETFNFTYLIYNDLFFTDVFNLHSGLDYNASFSSDLIIKYLYNLALIIMFLSFILNPKLLFGSYYFESKPKPDKYQKPKNHWSNIRLKKIVTVDYKTFNDLEEHSLNIIDKLIEIEAKFINNTVAYDNIEDVSQLINEKTHHVEFIFKYHNILSFSKYILKLKMLRAAFLIEEGYLINNSVNDLSALSGYNSRSAFFTKFKEINGFSPTRY